MDYAIIRVGGKQYRVREGETLVVDRLKTDEGKTFTPELLLGAAVTAKVVSHERGPKIRIGKYRRRTGYKRHNGFRAAITRIQIESIAGASKPAAVSEKAVSEKAVPDKAAAKKGAAPKAEVVETAAGETVAVETVPVEAVAVEAVVVETVAIETAAVETPAAEAPSGGLPEGYEGFTVAQIQAGTGSWSAAELGAALAYEQEHAKRKGALAALTSAIEKEGDS
jgi:large subunit ribosomal protein L21